MLLGFLRHAQAEDEAHSDFDRRLTARGLEQAEKVGKFCLRHGLLPELVLYSPVVRARQTADVVTKLWGEVPSQECAWLACGMGPETLMHELAAYAKFSKIYVVGHEPDFSQSMTWLLGLNGSGSLHIRKASFTLLHVPSLRAAAATLEFSVPVRLM
jgi:phosphohistidine phosphatase